MDVLTAGYLIFSILSMLTLLFNYFFVKYYCDPHESYPLAILTIVCSLSVTLICVLLIPIDILITSDTGFKEINNESIKNTILFLFSFMLISAFVLTPFAYFYGEETFDEIDGENEATCEKVCESCKYTAVTVLVFGLLFIIGLIFRPDKKEK